METPKPYFNEYKQGLIKKGVKITTEIPNKLIAYTLPPDEATIAMDDYRGEYGEAVISENTAAVYSLEHSLWSTRLVVPSDTYPHVRMLFHEGNEDLTNGSLEWVMVPQAINKSVDRSRKPIDEVACARYEAGELKSVVLGCAWDYLSNVRVSPFSVIKLNGQYDIDEMAEHEDDVKDEYPHIRHSYQVTNDG